VHADVEPREAHSRGEHEERRRERGKRKSEHNRGRKARCGVTRGEARSRRRRHEHVDPVQRLLRAPAVGGRLEAGCREVRQQHDRRYSERDTRATQPDSCANAERDPEQAVRSRIAEADEEWIEPVDAMLDDPPLETLIEVGQGVVTVVVTVIVSRVAATGTIVRVSVVAPSGV
jgi:hypothetical protein